MSIVTPNPISYGYPTNNIGTESARRDNMQREFIPPVLAGERSAAEKSLSPKEERHPQQLLQQPTYDKPSVNQELFNQASAGQEGQKDNARDESAGKQDQAQQQELSEDEQAQVKELKDRDSEVRLHEQAHAAVGGQYAGAPQYDYETGPDGRRYAVAGEVSIDVSEAASAQETVRKMQQVKAAALAPAEPSAQDYKVANEASQKEREARSEVAQEQLQQSTDSEPVSATLKASEVIASYYMNATTPRSNELGLRA